MNTPKVGRSKQAKARKQAIEPVPTILDCGHPPDEGHPANVGGQIVQGWRFVVTDNGRKVCHACADKIILDCGHNPTPHDYFTPGYGMDEHGKKHCYACCADTDRKRMSDTGRATLYLGKDKLTNWPGSLVFPVTRQHTSRHNIGRTRTDVWFIGPDRHVWHGYQIGDWTQITHCKRTAQTV